LGLFLFSTVFAAEEIVNGVSSEGVYSFEDGGLQLYQSEGKDKKLTLGGEIMTRYAYWNWFEASSDNNEYSYGFQRTRFNLKFSSKVYEYFCSTSIRAYVWFA